MIVLIDNEEQILESPWSNRGPDAERVLLDLEDKLSVVSGERLMGRIDIRQASHAVLLSVPGMPRRGADEIVAQRERRKRDGTNASFESVLSMVDSQLLTWEELREMGPYLTTSGAIYSGYSASHDLFQHSSSIVKFTLCIEGSRVRLLEHRDLGQVPLHRIHVPHERTFIN